MSLALKFYLIDLLCEIPIIFIVIGICFFLKIFYISLTDDESEKSREVINSLLIKYLKRGCIWILIAIFVSIIIPSRKSFYFYLGVHSIEKFVESNDKAEEIPQLAIEAFHKYLKEGLENGSQE